jgi:DNA-binding GntR family transcriptional regulator
MSDQQVRLQVVSTVDALARILRDQILDGTIKPGERLREIEYAERFEVARHSFRAATQVLVHEGLLERAANRSLHVPVLDADDVSDIYRARETVEVEAVRICIHEDRSIDGAVAAVEEMSRMSEDAPWREMVDLDIRFHRSFVDATGSLRLNRMYTTVQSEMTLCLVQLRSHYSRPVQEVAAEHRDLLEPVLARDDAEAVRRLRTHLAEAVLHLRELVHQVRPGT